MLRAPYFQSNVKYFVQVACFLKFYNSKIFCAGNRVFAVLHSRKPLFGWCRTYWSAPALTFWIKSSLMYPVHVQKNRNKNCPKFEVWSLAHIFFITYTYTSYICWLFTVLNEVFQAKDGNSVYLYKYRRNRILLRRGFKSPKLTKFRLRNSCFYPDSTFHFDPDSALKQDPGPSPPFLSCLYIAFFCI